jgi:separase
MPRNRTTSDSRQPILQDPEISYSTSDALNELNIPALKQILLQRAWEHWNIHKNEKYAIFYQTISFCLSSTLSHQENLDLSSYLEKINNELSYQSNEKPSIYNYSNFEDINKYLEREIASTCRHQFPKEWTVIQLCKNFNPLTLSSKYEDIIQFNTGISMTIFKHSAIKDMLMLEVRKQSQLENIFEKTYKINKKISDNLVYRTTSIASENQENKEKYWRASKDIEIFIQDVIKLLTSFFGPWKALLTGNFKNRKSIETENEIRKQVIEFLNKKNFTDYQEKLIHLIARRTDLLSNQQIFVAITYILQDKSNLGYNDVDLNDLYDHLTWIKQEYKYEDTSTYPCILIIDELLDQMPFEMINPQQEFTRICSFSGLKQLLEHHCNSIDNNGYLMTPTANCQAIVNPDQSLTKMEDRLRNFFNYWLPSWKVMYNQMPSKEQFHDILSQSDIFAYFGHGSGFEYSFNENIYDIKTNGIVFLFGCGSTSLTSIGLNSELKGPHAYYHLGNCPTVIGFLWTITDFNTDLCATRILSSWIKASSTKAHWQLIDKELWKKNGNLAFTKTIEIISSDSLSEIITKMHSDSELPISFRAALVYRGLPVIASDNSIQNSYKY